tara:strand:+ start:379 stop:519 length:141 start_codon:yes stop_codon:yes gene_type:complete
MSLLKRMAEDPKTRKLAKTMILGTIPVKKTKAVRKRKRKNRNGDRK